jgi:hypothetical protein
MRPVHRGQLTPRDWHQSPHHVVPALVLGAVAALGGVACESPCCRALADCAPGTVCFEGACALRCEDDTQCDEGFLCAATQAPGDEAQGVCRSRVEDPGSARCQDRG